MYWKRVAEMDCNDKLALMDAKKSKSFYWKAFGIECRFTKLLEDTSPSDFIEEKFIHLAERVSFVDHSKTMATIAHRFCIRLPATLLI